MNNFGGHHWVIPPVTVKYLNVINIRKPLFRWYFNTDLEARSGTYGQPHAINNTDIEARSGTVLMGNPMPSTIHFVPYKIHFVP